MRDGAIFPATVLMLLKTRIENESDTYRRSFAMSRPRSKSEPVSIVLGPWMIRSTTIGPADGFALLEDPMAALPESATNALLGGGGGGGGGGSPPPPQDATRMTSRRPVSPVHDLAMNIVSFPFTREILGK